MDYNQNNNSCNIWSSQNQQYNNNRNVQNSGFSIASMICGIASIILCCTGILSLPMGALGIIFAILTRRVGKGMPSMSIAGLWTSIVGMVFGIGMLVYTFSLLPSMLNDPYFRNQLDYTYEQMYGMDFEEFWEYYLPSDLD